MSANLNLNHFSRTTISVDELSSETKKKLLQKTEIYCKNVMNDVIPYKVVIDDCEIQLFSSHENMMHAAKFHLRDKLRRVVKHQSKSDEDAFPSRACSSMNSSLETIVSSLNTSSSEQSFSSEYDPRTDSEHSQSLDSSGSSGTENTDSSLIKEVNELEQYGLEIGINTKKPSPELNGDTKPTNQSIVEDITTVESSTIVQEIHGSCSTLPLSDAVPIVEHPPSPPPPEPMKKAIFKIPKKVKEPVEDIRPPTASTSKSIESGPSKSIVKRNPPNGEPDWGPPKKAKYSYSNSRSNSDYYRNGYDRSLTRDASRYCWHAPPARNEMARNSHYHNESPHYESNNYETRHETTNFNQAVNIHIHNNVYQTSPINSAYPPIRYRWQTIPYRFPTTQPPQHYIHPNPRFIYSYPNISYGYPRFGGPL